MLPALHHLNFNQVGLSHYTLKTSMDFARKQLEKYGWKEGEGLGKNKSGIPKALRPKLKFDTGGLGHDLFEDINNTWWKRVYDEAAKNIITKTDESGVVALETVNESIDITTKKNKRKRKKDGDSIYKEFIKTSQLNGLEETKIIGIEMTEEETPKNKKKEIKSGITDLTDDELFKICEGRTAHKGARHGLCMSAKLARIEKQENSLNGATTEGNLQKKKHKKSKTKKEK